MPTLVTDGAYLPDGRFVLRTYGSVYVYDRPGHEVASDELPLQPQGESVAADGDRLLVGSEGLNSEVLAVPIPGGATTESPSAEGTTTPAGDARRRRADRSRRPTTGGSSRGAVAAGRAGAS